MSTGTSRAVAVWVATLLAAWAVANDPPAAGKSDSGPVVKAPHVSALSAVVMDAATGKILWAKDPDTPRYPASTTKIMTALLLLENCRLDEAITAPFNIEKVTESSLHLKPFEQVSVRDMLYGLMLRSANDGAYAAACHVAGSEEKFAEMMNERAKSIGCTNTHFTNPHGLQDEAHVTTARDLALIAREAMKNPTFREVARTPTYRITRSINRGDERLVSKNRLFRTDPTLEGIKTGFTVPAGRCYVGAASRNGYRLITVVLKSNDWQLDHEQLLAWAFANHVRVPLAEAGQVVGKVDADGARGNGVACAPMSEVDALLPLGSVQAASHPQVLQVALEAPVRKGQLVGFGLFTDASGYVQRVPLYATEDVERAASLWAALATPPGATMVAASAAGLLIYRRKSKRRRLYARASKHR